MTKREFIIQELDNSAFIEDRDFYKSTAFLLEKIERKFGNIPREFARDFSSTIQEMNLKYNDFNYSQLKEDFLIAIENADKFKDLHFTYEEQTYKIDYLNNKIENDKYLINQVTNDKIEKGDIVNTSLSEKTIVLDVLNDGKDAILFTGTQFIYANGIQQNDNKLEWGQGQYSFDLQGVLEIMNNKQEQQKAWDLPPKTDKNLTR